MMLDRPWHQVGWVRFFLKVIVCGALVALGATARDAKEETLAGPWKTTIFDDAGQLVCTTVDLFTRDGGDVAQGCDISESPGYGQWQRIGDHEFAVTFVGVNFGPAGTGITSTYKVRGTVRLSHDGQTSSGPYVVDVFGLDGTLLFSATGTVHSERIGVEPL